MANSHPQSVMWHVVVNLEQCHLKPLAASFYYQPIASLSGEVLLFYKIPLYLPSSFNSHFYTIDKLSTSLKMSPLNDGMFHDTIDEDDIFYDALDHFRSCNFAWPLTTGAEVIYAVRTDSAVDELVVGESLIHATITSPLHVPTCTEVQQVLVELDTAQMHKRTNVQNACIITVRTALESTTAVLSGAEMFIENGKWVYSQAKINRVQSIGDGELADEGDRFVVVFSPEAMRKRQKYFKRRERRRRVKAALKFLCCDISCCG